MTKMRKHQRNKLKIKMWITFHVHGQVELISYIFNVIPIKIFTIFFLDPKIMTKLIWKHKKP